MAFDSLKPTILENGQKELKFVGGEIFDVPRIRPQAETEPERVK